MSMLRHAGNSILGRLGLRICRRASYLELLKTQHRHKRLILEVGAMLETFLFTDIPKNENRAELLSDLSGTSISEAMYIIHHLHRCLRLQGDVCEFGVAEGATSAVLANELLDTNKNLWLFDSFAGLSKPTEKDRLINDIFDLGSIDKYQGRISFAQAHLVNRLKNVSFPTSRTKIVAGFIEDTIRLDTLPRDVCFAYVDFDFYEPIRLALGFLNDHLVPGGYVIVDDYGWFSAGAKTAVDELIEMGRERFERLLPHAFAGKFCILRKR